MTINGHKVADLQCQTIGGAIVGRCGMLTIVVCRFTGTLIGLGTVSDVDSERGPSVLLMEVAGQDEVNA